MAKRPIGCCGVCPPIVGGGYDCTCAGNPRCPKRTPQRIQRKRTKGWRMPEGAIYVGRPTKWGNPYRVGDESAFIGANPVFNMDEEPLTAADVKELFRIALGRYVLPVTPEDVRRELGGHDLACWCPLEDGHGNRMPCHADVLLELANGEEVR